MQKCRRRPTRTRGAPVPFAGVDARVRRERELPRAAVRVRPDAVRGAQGAPREAHLRSAVVRRPRGLGVLLPAGLGPGLLLPGCGAWRGGGASSAGEATVLPPCHVIGGRRTGFAYPCVGMGDPGDDDLCRMVPKEFNGAPCSDAAGMEARRGGLPCRPATCANSTPAACALSLTPAPRASDLQLRGSGDPGGQLHHRPPLRRRHCDADVQRAQGQLAVGPGVLVPRGGGGVLPGVVRGRGEHAGQVRGGRGERAGAGRARRVVRSPPASRAALSPERRVFSPRGRRLLSGCLVGCAGTSTLSATTQTTRRARRRSPGGSSGSCFGSSLARTLGGRRRQPRRRRHVRGDWRRAGGSSRGGVMRSASR